MAHREAAPNAKPAVVGRVILAGVQQLVAREIRPNQRYPARPFMLLSSLCAPQMAAAVLLSPPPGT